MSEATQQKIPLSKETIDLLNEQGPGDKPETYDSIIQRLCKESGKSKAKTASSNSDNGKEKQGQKEESSKSKK